MTDSTSKRLFVSEQNFGRYLVGLVALGFLALFVAAAMIVWLQVRNQDHARLIVHTQRVQTELGTLAASMERAETIRRGYLISGNRDFRSGYLRIAGSVPKSLETLSGLISDNERQQASLARLQEVLAQQRELQRGSILLVDRGNARAVTGNFRFDRSVLLIAEARRIVEAMQAEEQRLLDQRDDEQVRSLRIFYIAMAITGALVLGVGVISVTVILRYNRDLTESRDRLRTLNENLEEAVQERTEDLQRANDEIQRFAYIVSHDLRSPLVNVMGFTAELDASRKPLLEMVDAVEQAQPGLVTEAARLAVREDLPEAIGFIRTSTQKMDRLINAILKLSREGRRTIAPETVEVGELIEGIIGSLQHRVSGIGAEIRIEPPLPVIVTDRFALEQIFSNLIENAVKYLQPGRPGLIRVRGTHERERVIYEVEDNGRGVDPRDHQRIFDLFRRSGQQDQPGEGIGLAHVRALAYRLGGVISVQSELDRGATFRLSLPARFEAAKKLGTGEA